MSRPTTGQIEYARGGGDSGAARLWSVPGWAPWGRRLSGRSG